MEIKQYTKADLAASLVELYEGDPAGLARAVLQINGMINGGSPVAEYRNAELSPNSWGDRRYIGLLREKPVQNLIGDSQGTSRMYQLHAIYDHPGTATTANAVLDLPAMLGELKISRPAVAYIRTKLDVNGNSRTGWAVYRDQKLIEFVRKDIGETYYKERLKELGADEEWATGEIKVSEEVWEEITDEDNWPTTSRKFSSHRAERLYNDEFDDDNIGDSDWGFYRLFKDELTILTTDTQGFVSADVYTDDEEMIREWERLSEAWEQYNEDDEE